MTPDRRRAPGSVAPGAAEPGVHAAGLLFLLSLTFVLGFLVAAAVT